MGPADEDGYHRKRHPRITCPPGKTPRLAAVEGTWIMTERMEVDFEVPVAMRDGVLLYADVYRPGGQARGRLSSPGPRTRSPCR